MAQISAKFKEMGSEVYLDAVKKSNEALGVNCGWAEVCITQIRT